MAGLRVQCSSNRAVGFPRRRESMHFHNKLPYDPNLRLASKPIDAEELLAMLRDLLEPCSDGAPGELRQSG